MVKLKPHHDLAALQARFATVEDLEVTNSAIQSSRTLGFALEDVLDVIQSLEMGDFVKSETAHSPPNSKIWHDTYVIEFGGWWLYLKFSGETLIDMKLASFKERN